MSQRSLKSIAFFPGDSTEYLKMRLHIYLGFTVKPPTFVVFMTIKIPQGYNFPRWPTFWKPMVFFYQYFEIEFFYISVLENTTKKTFLGAEVMAH